MARHLLADTFLLMNGDSWLDFILLDLVALHTGSARPATLALRRVADASRYGVVELDGVCATRFLERLEQVGPGLINGGVYVRA